jgi:hypothetical protein
MYRSTDSGGPTTDPQLTFAQGVQMAQHCFVRFP